MQEKLREVRFLKQTKKQKHRLLGLKPRNWYFGEGISILKIARSRPLLKSSSPLSQQAEDLAGITLAMEMEERDCRFWNHEIKGRSDPVSLHSVCLS